MKISLRPLKMLLPFLLVLCLEQVFWEFFIDDSDNPLLIRFELVILCLGFATACWYWRRMEAAMSGALLLTMGYLLVLMLESYAMHGTWVVYPHVFFKVMVLFLMYGTYGYYLRRGLPPLKPLVAVLFVVMFLNLAFIHPEALSIQGFLDTERGFSSSSALMLVLPTLLCLNWYLQRGRGLPLLMFFAGLGLIIFLQHRSVWMTMLLALAVNLLLLWRRVPEVRFVPRRVVLLLLLPATVVVMGGLATVLDNPEVLKKFEASYEDITKADTQGTGSWRFKQMRAYEPLVAERPLLGWRLAGFEVPMQFYDPTSDAPMWPDGTGHHFHSFYLDRLFYFGWGGLLLVLVPLFMQIIKRLTHPEPLTVEIAALISLVVGCLAFGLSYDWPNYLYALLGLVLAATAQPGPVPAVPEPVPDINAESVYQVVSY